MSKKKENEQRETVAHDLRSQIVGFKAAATLPLAQARAVTPDKESAAGMAKVHRSMVSVQVKDKLRCGRAPYNFVPEPDPPRKWREAPTQETYDDERVSGYIDLSIDALSDFFIRGWRTLADHRRFTPNEEGKIPPVLDSFLIHGKPGIPGSSLRGMVRTIFEILSLAELDPINNRRMFYRAVGTSDQSGEPSFEPQAETYKDRLFRRPIAIPSRPSAKVGLLEMDGPDWVIRPMKTQTICRYDGEYYNGQLGYWKVCFRPSGAWGTVLSSDVRDSAPGVAGTQGWLICSGLMGDKHTQWIVYNDPDRSQTLKVSGDLRSDFLEEGVTQWMKSGKGSNFRYARSIMAEGRPIFYIIDTAGKVSAFGHTPFFRTPYDHTAHSLRKPSAGEEPWGDMAKSVFGTLRTGGKSGRVFFEDAQCISPTYETAGEKTVVLGSPKPTTYQHYLHQESYEHGKIEFWDSNPKARLRGHKLYWHRPPADYPLLPPTNNLDMVTKLKPVLHRGEGERNDPKFKSRIRFDNLSSEELGCLLLVFDLPQDQVKHAHKIGMGKPLGLGSFKITVDQVMRINRVSRYGKLLDDDGSLVRAEEEINPADLAKFEASFAEWYLSTSLPSEADAQEFVRGQFWTDPRLKELLAILSWPPPENVSNEAWKNRTRYMGIEQALYGGRFDEYRKVWDARGQKTAPRKPLPPATQVWTNEPAVPDDSYKPYERPRQSGAGGKGRA